MQKLINTKDDIPLFKRSPAYKKLSALLEYTNTVCTGLEVPQSTENTVALDLIDQFRGLEQLLDSVALAPSNQRFGNIAFREWHAQAGPTFAKYGPDLGHYFSESWGNPERLDYGTGHELNFLALMGGIMDTFKGSDILYVWDQYYTLCRKIIIKFRLEPAGSHGAWGLDDHFHLCYIFGSAEIKVDPEAPRPKSILDLKVVDELAPVNLYFSSIKFINQVKRGPFFEHSPLLFDASNAANWTKINKGMVRMYHDNVFDKFPVMQHFYFGKVYEFS